MLLRRLAFILRLAFTLFGIGLFWPSARPIITAIPYVLWPTAGASLTSVSLSEDRVGYHEEFVGIDDSRIAPTYASRIHAQYTFTVRGQRYSGSVIADPSGIERERLTPGQALRVRYNSSDPSHNVPALPIRPYYWIGIAVSLLLLCLGLWWPALKPRRAA